MKRILVILLAQMLLSTVCLAQGTSVQEKVYLHFDSNFYFAGDTIWYAAYTVRADSHRPTDVSRILYVELLNEQGYSVERQQLAVGADGRVNGQFALCDTAFAGYYEVRAYTKWMMNFRDIYGVPHMFSRVLPVYQRNDTIHSYKRRMMPRKTTAGNYEVVYPNPKFNIRFYPEGGHIVEGQEQRVAFEVCDEQMQRLDLEGELLEGDSVVSRLKTVHLGRGVFSFIPQEGKKYRTRFVVDGVTYENNIVGIEPDGVAMRVERMGDAVAVQLSQTGQRFGVDSLTLRVLCRGVEEMAHRVSLADGTADVSFPTEYMREGVNEVVLCDGNGEVIASRMVFVRPAEALGLLGTLRSLKSLKSLKPYGHQQLTMDFGRELANMTLSLAVADANQRGQSYDASNIATELLLQSDVRGYVENAAWYFESDDKQHRQALDLLMMVQGWSRYDWGRAAKQPKYEAERTTVVNCELQDVDETVWTRKTRRQRKAVFASLYKPESGELFRGSMYADSTGRFQIPYEPFYGTATLQISAFYADKLKTNAKYSRKLHDDKIFIRCEGFHPLNDLRQYSWYETHEPDTLDDLMPAVADAIALGNVTVNAKKHRRIRRTNMVVARYDFIDFLNEYFDYGDNPKEMFGKDDSGEIYVSDAPFSLFNRYLKYKELYNVWQQDAESRHIELIPHEYRSENLLMDTKRIPVKLDLLLDLFNDIMTTAIDGMYINVVTVNFERSRMSWFGRNYNRIDSLNILTDTPRRPTCYKLLFPQQKESKTEFKGTGSVTSIATFRCNGYNFYKIHQKGKGSELMYGRRINLQGFNRPAEFYSPDYSRRPLPEQPDYRHTLYWNPAVKTDDEGRAHIEFYNNAVCTELHISAEGLTEDGRMVAY